MASLGGLESLIGSLPPDLKRPMTELLRAFAPWIRFGPVDDGSKCENMAGFTIVSTTATSTGEFSVAHGIGRAPYRAMPVLDLASTGTALVDVRVSRPADASRLYLKAEAGSTGKRFALYVEA